MAELADALASGASGRKAVQVQPLFRAPNETSNQKSSLFCLLVSAGALAFAKQKRRTKQEKPRETPGF